MSSQSAQPRKDGPKLRNGRMPKLRYGGKDYSRYPQGEEKRSANDERGHFERDRSRIIHSASFRRLQGKTQVFAAGEGDFFRTRLAHTLKVAQIGKGLALRLGADPDLVEAISLAHDICHPPFGHSGETKLRKLMKNHGGFEANAQNIRLLTKLEEKSLEYSGLNLTRATIDGQMKYKQPFDPSKPKFYYVDDQPIVDWIAKDGSASGKQQSFDCQIMDWADEIAYSVHDLEDGIHSGFVTFLKIIDPDTETYVTNKTFEKMVEIYGD
jgi:dGTPase